MSEICIIGAGFSGAVIAHQLAQAGLSCDVFEARSHVAGNCHTARDVQTGVMIHEYGPHIFHTDFQRVWEFVCQFDEFVPYTNRVKAIAGGRVFPLPINLLTINQFFDRLMSPSEARAFLQRIGDQSLTDPATFEEQALRFIGKELYEAFFRGYTAKQWGIHPKLLPASILKRLPIRFNYDDNYYNSRFQGIPRNGYTHIVEQILNHPNIHIQLETKIKREDVSGYRHTFYTGPLDEWFGYSEGELGYRTLDFVRETHEGDFQGNAVINYCDASVPWTRISEHKHFAPWESHEQSVIFREYSRSCGPGDVPYYPLCLAGEMRLLDRYMRMAGEERAVTFAGRLGTYRYLDMDASVAEALNIASEFLLKEA